MAERVHEQKQKEHGTETNLQTQLSLQRERAVEVGLPYLHVVNM